MASEANGKVQTLFQEFELHRRMNCVLLNQFTLSCKYKGSGSGDYLFWYRQYPGSRPEYLLMVIPGSGPQIKERFNATANETVVDLIISSTAVSDSALYYCALRPTVTETHQTLY
uniref:Ig-like domain-containing protein n=1 Tax=Astyanax mexicanus TaxID=7994 RepID=A0A3B1JGV6_ASTMX